MSRPPLTFLVSVAVAAVPALVGCQNRPAQQPELTYGDKFPGPDEPRQVNRVQEAQAAAGARSDATLRLCHFDTGGGNPGSSKPRRASSGPLV